MEVQGNFFIFDNKINLIPDFLSNQIINDELITRKKFLLSNVNQFECVEFRIRLKLRASHDIHMIKTTILH